MAKIAWIYKDSSDDTNWIFTTEEPPDWAAEKKQIVYFDLEARND